MYIYTSVCYCKHTTYNSENNLFYMLLFKNSECKILEIIYV